MKRKKTVLALTVVGVSILSILLSLSFLVSSPLKGEVIREAGEEVHDVDFYKNPALFKFFETFGIHLINCKRITDFNKLPLDRVGNNSVQFLVNGKNVSSILKIRDTKEPELIAKDIVIPAGEKVKAEDFSVSLEDFTFVRLKAKGLSAYTKNKKEGKYKVSLIATDDGGNKAKADAVLYALPIKKTAKAELGDKEVSANIFLKKKKEKDFSLSFKEDFNVKALVKQVGKHMVPITVSIDGKKKSLELKLIIEDTKPPVFIGTEDIHIGIGEEVSYRKGLRVMDNQVEPITFKVDAAKVNNKKEGSYPVYLFAKDKAGNETMKKITVNVLSSKKSHIKEVRAYVKDTLNQLITEEMTDVMKLRKIFDFCRQIKYRSISEKESVIEAAYEGFKTGTGDCFTYYSVARLLLTEAGFEEEMVKREGGEGEHFWNLVKYEEEWYHFDSCPIAGGDGFTPFLVNDEELLRFSEKYGVAFPAKKGYYQFQERLYPERAKKPLRKSS